MDGGAAARGGETRRRLPWKRFSSFFVISSTSAFPSLSRTRAIASKEKIHNTKTKKSIEELKKKIWTSGYAKSATC